MMLSALPGYPERIDRVRRNSDPHSVTSGVAIAIGLFQPWFIADTLLLFTGYPYRRPPLGLLLIAIPIPLVALWTQTTLDGYLTSLLFALRIVTLYSTIRHIKHPGATLTVAAAILAAQAVFALFVFTEMRPVGLTLNAQQFAVTNFVLLNAFPFLGMIGVALSGARFPMALIWFFTWFSFYPKLSKKLIVYASIASIVFLFGLYSQEQLYRIDVTNVLSNAETRKHLATTTEPITDAIVLHNPEAIKENPERKWKWQGYGYNRYNYETGLDTPHNVFISVLFEMGAFSVMVFVGTWLMMRRMPLQSFMVAASYMLFIDDFYIYPYGMYAAALFVIPLYVKSVAGRSSQSANPVAMRPERGV